MILTHNQLFMPRSQLYWWYFIWFVHLMMILAIILKIMSDQRFQLKVYQEQNYSLSSLWNPNDLLPETQSLQRDCTHTQHIQATSHAPHTWDTPHTMHWDDFFFPADAAQGHRWEVLLILLKGTSKVTNSIWHPLEPVKPVLRALKHQPACLCCDRTGTMEHFLLS